MTTQPTGQHPTQAAGRPGLPVEVVGLGRPTTGEPPHPLTGAGAKPPAFPLVAVASWLLFGVVALICIGLLLGDLHDVVGRRAFVYGVAFALAPAPFLVMLFYLLDRVRPEPTYLMVVALVWGACIATYIALRVNGWVGGALDPGTDSPIRDAVFVAPWVEESAKGLVIFAIVWWQRHRDLSALGGVVYGGLVGVGFAFTENIVYYSGVFQSALNTSHDNAFALNAVKDLFQWRGIAAPFVHPMFTLLTGLGIGIAVRQRNNGVRVLAPVAGFLGAVLLHMSYNTLASYSSHRGLTAAYIGVLLPALIVVAVVVFLVRRHERRVIAARLHDYVTLGWLTAPQVDAVTTRAGRRRTLRDARHYGDAAWRRARRVLRDGVELGAVRDRVVRGIAGDDDRAQEQRLLAVVRASPLGRLPATPTGFAIHDTAAVESGM